VRITFERVPWERVPWDELDGFADRTVHQCRPWLGFLAETQSAVPVVLRVRADGAPVGWFTGARVRRLGVPLLGSPMRGWSTSHMGFNLVDDALVLPATVALTRATTRLAHAVHLELMDRRIREVPPGFRTTPLHGLEVAIDLEDEALLASLTAHGRRDVRKGLRSGVVVEEVAGDDPTFVAEYQAQAEAAFARRGLVPTHPPSLVEALVRHVHPAGHLLLLRARLPSGEPVASGIFAGLPGSTAWFTLQASSPDAYAWGPNDVMVWEAMRAWRDRGAVRFDLGGRDVASPRDFKRKFGGTPTTTQWLRWSRLGALEQARTAAAKLHKAAQRRAGAARGRGVTRPGAAGPGRGDPDDHHVH